MSTTPAEPVMARGRATRRALLDAAEAVFAESGYEGASVAEITRRAGVAQGTFYVHFADKHAAFLELVWHVNRSVREARSLPRWPVSSTTMHQPIVTPNVAGLGFTVTALLMILIGGLGTISGAIVGAAVYRLLQFFLDRWFGVGSPSSSSAWPTSHWFSTCHTASWGRGGSRPPTAPPGRGRLMRLFTGKPTEEERAEVS